MKNKIYFVIISILYVSLVLLNSNQLYSQQDEYVPERLKYYKEKYEATYNEEYEIVFKAVKKTLDDIACLIATESSKQDDNGLFRGVIKSDFCVYSQGKDSTFSVMKKYSYKIPHIPGGVWLNARMQYTIIIKENEDGTVYLTLRGEMSGFEDLVTHEVHFWKSNGYFEHHFMEGIQKNIALLKEEKKE